MVSLASEETLHRAELFAVKKDYALNLSSKAVAVASGYLKKRAFV